VLVAVVFGLTALGSVLVGLLAGASLARSISLGFYLVGSLLVVLGVFSGIRGPFRPRGRVDEERPFAGSFGLGIFGSGARVATAEERVDARATSWLFLLIGIGLILAGTVVDSRVGLV
jgi:hypothetical protein